MEQLEAATAAQEKVGWKDMKHSSLGTVRARRTPTQSRSVQAGCIVLRRLQAGPLLCYSLLPSPMGH